MALYIARHGQTDWNKQRRFQSSTDVPLNDTGRRQAQALAKLLMQRSVVFSNVWSSPLQRAMQTAHFLIDSHDPTPAVVAEPDFVELGLGEFEGKFADDLDQQYGDVFRDWQRGAFVDAAPGGESMQQAIDRVSPALTSIRRLSTSHDVLIVAHQGANMAIKSALEGELSVQRLSQHRQSNDEIDIWDEKLGRVIERLSVEQAVNQ